MTMAMTMTMTMTNGAMIMTDIDPGVRGPRSQLSGPRLVADENVLELLEL